MPDIPKSPALPQLLDITELAQHLGVQARHVRRLVHEKRIPYIKWEHLIRFDPADVTAWLEANRRAPRPPDGNPAGSAGAAALVPKRSATGFGRKGRSLPAP